MLLCAFEEEGKTEMYHCMTRNSSPAKAKTKTKTKRTVETKRTEELMLFAAFEEEGKTGMYHCRTRNTNEAPQTRAALWVDRVKNKVVKLLLR